MSDEKSPLHEAITSLQQQRDEIALKIHLAGKEAAQEFESAKDQLDQLTADYEPLKEAVAESAENVSASLKLVANEVMSSFERIRKSL